MASQGVLTETNEFLIPFPGGHIAAKTWGKEGGIPVLALHGWQDNIGTFDRLAPLLSSDLYIVGFDHLGHGWSSHKPPGSFYNYIDMLIEIQRVVNYLKWEHFSIMAHSLGATLALLYGALFPESVSDIISLDIFKPRSKEPNDLSLATRYALQSNLELELKLNKAIPVYSLEEAKKRLMSGLMEEITNDAADVLLRRGVKLAESGDGVVFTRDIRVQMIECIQLFSHVDLMAYLCNLKCNLLIITGKSSKAEMEQSEPEIIDQFVSVYKNNCRSFNLVKVEGNHFVHINNPDTVAPHINEFFKNYGRQMSM